MFLLQGLGTRLRTGLIRGAASLSRSSSSAPPSPNEQAMSPAMKYYLSKKRKHDAFMEAQSQEFERGKAQLARMMGSPLETLSQEEVDRAIEYLFPSGLHDPRARPVLRPPESIFPKKKDAEFDFDGRPFHPFFYCVSPNFIQSLHELVDRLQMLQFLERTAQNTSSLPRLEASFFSGSEWIPRESLSDTYLEDISEEQYREFTDILERLSVHPFAFKIKDFLSKYRVSLGESSSDTSELTAGTDAATSFLQPEFDEKGAAYVEAIGQRKSSVARVRVTKPGTGSFTLRHIDFPTEDPQGIRYFSSYLQRHQILLPLQFTRLLGSVDVDCVVGHGGPSGQAGAIRYALSTCLKSFVDSETVDEMRVLGLLTQDVRVRERKRFGHVKSRKKFKFKKR
eukprot:TRINITY_DN4785_c0_g1_i1.p1 TRINITY_DN4785_c0_g1~~TRINITY_DN4785_c0_g1_i1.p1  ORF type:complete len:396 (+),score=116.78 TRINITY_DN4785_c0_g1_i1:42-1229(+)